jgi:hypothetical protein
MGGLTLESLVAFPIWVAWREEIRESDGEPVKVPYDPKTEFRRAESNNSRTWGSRSVASEWVANNHGNGVGVILSEVGDCYLCGIDLDTCRDAQTGEMTEWADEVVDRIASYTEISPSGTGVKIFFAIAKSDWSSVSTLFARGAEWGRVFKNGLGKHPPAIEVHRGMRYFTVTENDLGCGDEIRVVSVADLKWVLTEAGPKFAQRRSNGADKEYKTRDPSRSGFAFRIALLMRGKTYEQMKQAMLNHISPRVREWARTKGMETVGNEEERELHRAYNNAKNWKEPEKEEDDEPPLPLGLAIDIIPQPNEFLWWPYLPQGEAVIFAGPGGVGKGLAAADIAARVTRGRRWPMSTDRAKSGNVLWMEDEDSMKKTMRARWEAAGADLTRIIPCDVEQFLHLVNRDLIIQRDVRLIVLSPLVSVLDLDNSINEVTVRRELKKLSALYVDLPTTLLGLMHPNKKNDQSAIQRISGAGAFVNFPRCTIIVNAEKPDDDEEEGERDPDKRFRLTHQKHNLSVEGNDLIGVISNRRDDLPRGQHWGVDWEAATANIDKDTALDRKKAKKDDDGEDHRSAGEWLRGYLTAHGATPTDVIKEEAEKRGYRWGTVLQAKKRNREIEHELTNESPPKTIWKIK